MKRDDILKEVSSWEGTPYVHQGMVKGVGTDCAMFVFAVALKCKLLKKSDQKRIPLYSIEWHLHNHEEKLLMALEDFGCTEINIEDVQPGDILCFKYGRTSSHLGIMIDDTYFMHAAGEMKKVILSRLAGDYKKRLVHAYKFPGVQ